jgi:hypothetical protein
MTGADDASGITRAADMEERMEQPTMFSCKICGEEFATIQQLTLHNREKHSQFEAPDAPQLQLQEHSESEERGEVF